VHALDLLLLAQLQTEVAGARARGAAVLAGLAVELGFVRNSAARALQIEVGAFAAGQLGLGSEITCHLCSFDCLSDASPTQFRGIGSRESGGMFLEFAQTVSRDGGTVRRRVHRVRASIKSFCASAGGSRCAGSASHR